MTACDKAVNYKDVLVIDSNCSNHMVGNANKLSNMIEYKKSQVVITADNSKLSITHIDSTVVVPQFNSHQVQLQNVYHILGTKKNFLSVSQLTTYGNYIVFEPDNVKVYKSLKVTSEPIMEGKRLGSIYVITLQTTYFDNTRKNETANLWHIRLGHIGYQKLKVIMKSILKELP